MIRLAIFASGGGSNAEKIINYFKNHNSIKVQLIVSNRLKAYVLQRARNHGIEYHHLSKTDMRDKNQVLQLLDKHRIDYIALAGYLLLIPKFLIEAFPDRIINIHPSLLPKYGGKGMYGQKVHQAVFDNFEKESGMTIHLVNEAYDDGAILFQVRTPLEVTDTPDIIAQKVLKLEHEHYAVQIEKLIQAHSQN